MSSLFLRNPGGEYFPLSLGSIAFGIDFSQIWGSAETIGFLCFIFRIVMTEHYTVDLFRPGTAASAIVNQALSFRQPKLTPPQAFRRLDVIMDTLSFISVQPQADVIMLMLLAGLFSHCDVLRLQAFPAQVLHEIGLKWPEGMVVRMFAIILWKPCIISHEEDFWFSLFGVVELIFYLFQNPLVTVLFLFLIYHDGIFFIVFLFPKSTFHPDILLISDVLRWYEISIRYYHNTCSELIRPSGEKTCWRYAPCCWFGYHFMSVKSTIL